MYEISRETLNGFAPNSHGRHIWFLAQFEDQGQRSKVKVTRNKKGIFGHFGSLRVVYV